MADYVLLYSGGGMPATQAEQAAVLKEWDAWFRKLDGVVVDQGNPFTGKAKMIASDGKTSDGSVGPMATGYTIIKADSLNAAAEIAKGCPVLKSGAKITVYETLKVM